jgi:hypothetical protein
MPWELGYMDAFCGRVFVFPLDQDVTQGDTGQEYLDVYPVIDRANLREYLRRFPLDRDVAKGDTDSGYIDRPPRAPKWKEVGPIPPAGGLATDGYREWFEDNALRLWFDPHLTMKAWGDIWQGWFRLWGLR